MNEELIGFRISRHLNRSADTLPAATCDRLERARQQALRHANRHALRVAPGAPSISSWGALARSVAAAFALVVAVVGWNHWSDLQRANELEEVDSALLADELPINAYLDRRFDLWLAHAGDS